MRALHRATVATAAAATALCVAGPAFAANTASISVSHGGAAAGGAAATTLHIAIPQATDPIAAITIYVPTGYTLNLGQTAGTNIGTVQATAFSHDAGLTLPLSGAVVPDTPANHIADSTTCTGVATSAAVWNLNLSVAGQAIVLPVYVNQTAGAETALGAYKISVCLPPPDVPVGTPGRSAQGAQVLDTQFTVNGVFTPPSTTGLLRWEALFTPYNPGKGTVDLAGTFEARALVPEPVALSARATFSAKKQTYTVNGKLSEGGTPVTGSHVDVYRGTSANSLKKVAASNSSTGSWTSTGHRPGKLKVAYFQARASAGERDATAQGCQSPLTALAPAGCVRATLSPWTTASATVKLKL